MNLLSPIGTTKPLTPKRMNEQDYENYFEFLRNKLQEQEKLTPQEQELLFRKTAEKFRINPNQVPEWNKTT